MQFNYTLDEKKSWPPIARPKPPFGPTSIEVMRSCSLRNCFEVSPNYERRLGVAARIGTALHRTLQSLNQQPILAETTEQLAAETRRRFQAEIQEQQSQSAARPRENSLTWDHKRENRALEAVIAEAIRTQPLRVPNTAKNGWRANALTSKLNPKSLPLLLSAPVEVEIDVYSKNNLFRGKIDRAEKTENGIRLVDYKSAFRDDLPERYARQLQLYAYLWFETRSEWPAEAYVFYPILGSFHTVSVDKTICQQVASESAALIEKIASISNPSKLASPGDVCKVCEFRPWCRAFWEWQSSENNQLRAVDKANSGFEGKVKSIKLQNFYWLLTIDWRNVQVKLVAPQERFPHLANVNVGQQLRVLDTNLKGQLFQPTAHISAQSEIFIVLS